VWAIWLSVSPAETRSVAAPAASGHATPSVPTRAARKRTAPAVDLPRAAVATTRSDPQVRCTFDTIHHVARPSAVVQAPAAADVEDTLMLSTKRSRHLSVRLGSRSVSGVKRVSHASAQEQRVKTFSGVGRSVPEILMRHELDSRDARGWPGDAALGECFTEPVLHAPGLVLGRVPHLDHDEVAVLAEPGRVGHHPIGPVILATGGIDAQYLVDGEVLLLCDAFELQNELSSHHDSFLLVRFRLERLPASRSTGLSHSVGVIHTPTCAW